MTAISGSMPPGESPVLEVWPSDVELLNVEEQDSDILMPAEIKWQTLDTAHKRPRLLNSLRVSVISGRYRVGELLGEGASSFVFKAEDIKNGGSPVALKFLRSSFHGLEEERRRFWEEVTVSQFLDHPHIVRVFGAGLWNEYPYLVMEHVDGGTLRNLLDRTPGKRLTFREALPILYAICSALEHAHTLGISHHDIKPENVLLGRRGEVKLSDFGLAHQAVVVNKARRDAEISGTPYYMAPEQFNGKSPGFESDVYSFGIMAYEALMGKAPFEGDNFAHLLYQHCQLQLPRNTVEEVGVPCWFEQLLLKATDKAPENRYASARQLRRALLKNARVELGARPFDGLRNFLRPNGVLCTKLRMKGWSRPRIGATLAVGVSALVLLYKVLF